MEPARCSPSRTEVTMEIPASTPSPKSLGFRRRSVGCFSRPERSAAERGTGAHRDDPFRFGHLVVNSLYGKSHLVGDGTGHDHYVRLPRGESHYFCTKPPIPGRLPAQYCWLRRHSAASNHDRVMASCSYRSTVKRDELQSFRNSIGPTSVSALAQLYLS